MKRVASVIGIPPEKSRAQGRWLDLLEWEARR